MCIICFFKLVYVLYFTKYQIGSPTALANSEVEARLRQRANEGPHGLYIPSGALWGGNDIRKMADRGTLEGLKITMKKHPSCFKLNEPLKSKNEAVTDKAVVLYDGKARSYLSYVTVCMASLNV